MFSIQNVHKIPRFVQVNLGEVNGDLYVFLLLGDPETLE